MGEYKASDGGAGVFGPDGEIAFLAYDHGEAVSAAEHLNQLLRDVRVLQAFVEWMKRIDGECDLISSMSDGWEAADKAKNMEQEMVVGHHLLNECDGALTRWGGGEKE